MKNYCGIIEHPVGCACTKGSQMAKEQQMKSWTGCGESFGKLGDACENAARAMKETSQHLKILEEASKREMINLRAPLILIPKTFGQSLKKRKFK